MEKPKKLIEVAMPIKEISAESIRDKSIRHGHISTLQVWWARRPLPVCRAVVFASLVPDPLDRNCPSIFKDAVEILLGKKGNVGDPYKPYDDIPFTSAIDSMEDNQRNRLLMFIGKFSDKYIFNERNGRKTDAKDQISDASLIKWENRNNEEIINKARKLIWVAYNQSNEYTAETLLKEFDVYFNLIINAEAELYKTEDRHVCSEKVKLKEEKLQSAINAFLGRMPKIFDPFAGGGAIPLEAARLGCRSFGNDINPVAHIIQKGSAEFPQKFGKQITFSKSEFINLYGEQEFNKIPNERKIYENGTPKGVIISNRLSFDVEFYAKKILASVEKEIGHFYPSDTKGQKPIAYYWVKTAVCSNPSCKAEVPLLRQFYLANTKSKQVYLKPIINGNSIEFDIIHGKTEADGWLVRANLLCPCCNNVTEVDTLKKQFYNGTTKERLVAVIWDGVDGKEYRKPTDNELKVIESIPKDIERPNELMPPNDSQNLKIPLWGYKSFGDMFSYRQLLAIQTLISKLNDFKPLVNGYESEYYKAVITYLAILINRITPRTNMFGLWNVIGEKIEHVFGRQAIPMVFDYPESNVFAITGGGALNQLDWILRYIESESLSQFPSVCNHTSSGDKAQFESKSLTCVVTDPPYYDAIAYADLSDFFYVWYKRTISDLYPLDFSTPQTPKTEECTALKHHHNGDINKAKLHFENKLTQIFDAIEQQTSDVISIMYAHQSTEAWSTLCNSILGARMNITGSWAIDTERSAAGVKAKSAFLSSSVTVSCKPILRGGIGEYKVIRKDIDYTVGNEVKKLYSLGFRGADLLTACFGQAVSVFGQYERVEKADGSEITVAELLEMAKESAFNALLSGFDGDDFTKFYIGWLQLFGFTESDFDDAAKFARVGLTINVSDLFAHNLFIKKGNRQELAGYRERLRINHRIGEGSHSFIIDFVHKAMALYEGTNRNALLEYIAKVAASPDSSFWRVITSLCEILPPGSDDYKQASGLLLNKDSLIRESKNIQQSVGEQGQLF